jgi:hypothetical protein
VAAMELYQAHTIRYREGWIYIWAERAIAQCGGIQGEANFYKKLKNKLFQRLKIPYVKKLLVINL